jgi:hypothetical protein
MMTCSRHPDRALQNFPSLIPERRRSPRMFSTRGAGRSLIPTANDTDQAALCAGARRLRSLSVTGFPSASVPGWNSSRLPTDYVGMADVSRRARGARPCPRQMRMASAGCMGREMSC